MDLIKPWLSDVSIHLKPSGVLIATFLVDKKDHLGYGWIYPKTTKYRVETIERITDGADFDFLLLDWMHPRQKWFLFAIPELISI
jgi:flavin-dependent dehydrogenase